MNKTLEKLQDMLRINQEERWGWGQSTKNASKFSLGIFVFMHILKLKPKSLRRNKSNTYEIPGIRISCTSLIESQ